MLITIEGIDGSGKTSVSNAISDSLDVVQTREPYHKEWIGKQVRDAISDDSTHPVSVFLLFMADHAYHYQNVVKPNLDQIVVSDRYIDSRYAYQAVSLSDYVTGDTLSYIRKLHETPWRVDQDEFKTAQSEMPDDIFRNTPEIAKYFYEKSVEGVDSLSGVNTDFPELVEDNSVDWTKLPDKTLYIDISPETSMERLGKDKEVFETKEFLSTVRSNYHRLSSDTGRYIHINGEQSKTAVQKDALSKLTEQI